MKRPVIAKFTPTAPSVPTLRHHGAVEGVTGSCHELFLDDEHSVLIDCGLFQGAETAVGGAAESPEIRFDIRHVEALLLTHAHLDHAGRIPYLIAAGYKGPIYCSAPTAHLLPLMLEDAIALGLTRDARLIERFLDLLRARLVPVPYNTWTEVPLRRPGANTALAVRFQPAGHILGSAYVECDLRPTVRTASGRAPRSTRIVFSGDLGPPHTPLLRAPRAPGRADVLVLESTYGDRLHDDRRTRRSRLQAIVERCFENRGVILVPAFALGRTQELLYEIEQILHRHGRRAAAPGIAWQDLEIVVDSPLAARITHGYRELRAHWDREAKRRLASGRHPLAFEQITTIERHEDHLRAVAYLEKTARATIVIAASGMCAGGRIVNYLKALLGDPRTDVLFAGYQAAGTPGRAIQTYGPRGGYVELDGRRYTIRAGIHTLTGYSAHADQQDLVAFVRRMRRPPVEIRLVHGDAEAKAELRGKLESQLAGTRVIVPGAAASLEMNVRDASLVAV